MHADVAAGDVAEFAVSRCGCAYADLGGRAGRAGIGLVWGIVARIFMSLIADVSTFSVSGTTFILTTFAFTGAFAGLAFGARRRGWRSWRVYVPRALAALAIVPLALVAGGGLCRCC